MTPALAAYLRAISDRCEQATPGPWAAHALTNRPWIEGPGPEALHVADCATDEDALLVAAARTDLPTLVRLVRDAHTALMLARAGLVATSLGGVDRDDGTESALQSWCDDGWTCEHAECIAGRKGIEAIDGALARAEGIVKGEQV